MSLRPLPPNLEEVARQDLNEDPARREQDLQHIRDWLSKQPHLIARTDTQWLTTFLRGCKFSLERTKEKLDMFYTLRTALPELFTNRDPMLPHLNDIIKKGNVVPLPEPDNLGRRVILWRNGLVDFNKVKIMDLMKANMMVMDLLLYEDDQAIICGTVSLMDHKEAKASDIVHYTPSLAKKTSTVFQEGYPIRPKGMHHINMNPAFITIFNLFKSFMKEKMKKRIHLHSNMEDVYEHIPKRILPQEYGGEAGPLQVLVDKWTKKVEAHRSWYIEEDKYRSDEKKRPGGKPKTQEDLFGLEGSFRTLNVD